MQVTHISNKYNGAGKHHKNFRLHAQATHVKKTKNSNKEENYNYLCLRGQLVRASISMNSKNWNKHGYPERPDLGSEASPKYFTK